MKKLPLDLTKIPFGSADSRCMLFYETDGAALDAENGLYLSQSTEGMLGGGAQFYRNKDYLLISLWRDGAALPYTFTADMTAVCLKAEEAEADITFAPDGSMRIYAKGAGVRLTAKMGFGDVATMHGTAAEADMDAAAYYMIPAKGMVTVDSHYNLLTYRYTDPVIDFIPDGDNLEIAIFDKSYKDSVQPEIRGGFEDCVTAREAAFEEFKKALVGVNEETQLAAYGLWIAKKPFPNQENGAYPSNAITVCYPRAVEQPILSMAFLCGKEAIDLINKFTRYITKAGLVPEKTNRAKQLFQTVSMDYGYAVLALLEKAEITAEEAVSLYNLLSTVDGWWTANRSFDGGTSFYYAYRFECGCNTSSILFGGTPAVTPDLMTRMILQAKALSALAEKLGHTEAAMSWKAKAEARLYYLLKELWQNGSFTAAASGEKYTCGSALCYLPLLLGKLLPADIAKVLTASLMASPLAVPGRGLKAETDGTEIDTVITALLIAGLADCGFEKEAATVWNWLAAAEKANGLAASFPAHGEVTYRCGGMYPPVACAAMLFSASKVK